MNGTDHVHIQYDELKKLSELDLSKASDEDLQLLMDIDERAEQCPVCRERYTFFMDSAKILGWGRPAEMPLTARIMYEVESNLENMRGAAGAKLGEWLDGAKGVLQGFTAPAMKPAFGTVRGGRRAARTVVLEEYELGFYCFILDAPANLIFEFQKPASARDRHTCSSSGEKELIISASSISTIYQSILRRFPPGI